MDAFFSTLVLVALTEIGGQTQILAAALAIRFPEKNALISGIAIAIIANAILSAFLGAAITKWISQDPLLLFYAVSLIMAGFGMLAWRRPVDLLQDWKLGSFMTGLLGVAILQFGDKGQFIIGATAARTSAPVLAAAGGIIGSMVAILPAIVFQEKLASLIPIKQIRLISGFIILLAGFVVALTALRLI